MDRGSFAVARGLDNNVWHYGLVVKRKGPSLIRLLSMAEGGTVGPELDCRLAGASLVNTDHCDSCTARFLKAARGKVEQGVSRRSQDAMFRRLPGSYGSSRRR